MQIEWYPENSVGVESIDNQHKQLVVLVGDLFDAIMEERSHEVMRTILEGLAAYVGEHFTHEENMLAQYGFDPVSLKDHISEHRQLTAQLYEFMVQYNADTVTADLELYNFLRGWLTDHLDKTDKKYASFLQAHGAK